MSYNTDSYYIRSKTDQSPLVYPIDAGDISINGVFYEGAPIQIYPKLAEKTRYFGDISFNYVVN